SVGSCRGSYVPEPNGKSLRPPKSSRRTCPREPPRGAALRAGAPPASPGGETGERGAERFGQENDRWHNREVGIHLARRTTETSAGMGNRASSDRTGSIDQCP